MYISPKASDNIARKISLNIRRTIDIDFKISKKYFYVEAFSVRLSVLKDRIWRTKRYLIRSCIISFKGLKEYYWHSEKFDLLTVGGDRWRWSFNFETLQIKFFDVWSCVGLFSPFSKVFPKYRQPNFSIVLISFFLFMQCGVSFSTSKEAQKTKGQTTH